MVLFIIETERFRLEWGEPSKQPVPYHDVESPPGRLIVRAVSACSLRVHRTAVPSAVADALDLTIGPQLFEQTDYPVLLRSKTGEPVYLDHRDPTVTAGLRDAEAHTIVHGVINFGSQVGRARFTIRVGARAECMFEVEVFPSKLDYQTDYQQIMADVQSTFVGLALEYLRATYRPGRPVPVPSPTQLEWLVNLRSVVDELERALRFIAAHPHRAIVRELGLLPIERIRQTDRSIHRTLARALQIGGNRRWASRRIIAVRQAQATLDTPEHRWLAAQLARIRRRLLTIREQESFHPGGERRRAVLDEIRALEARVARMARLEPLAAVQGLPPAGFSSMVLLAAPGYREAYRACLMLSMGLRIEGGPLELSPRDLSALYEIWCYLATLRLLGELTRCRVPIRSLLAVEQRGVRIQLRPGRTHQIAWKVSGERTITVTYHPLFHGPGYLIPQRPDILITLSDPVWPSVHLVIDAKYRIDASEPYIAQYGAPGPPQDAINMLHRYRDAIVEWVRHRDATPEPRHTVVQGVALFPWREGEPGTFGRSRWWRALEQIGIGAIPLLPGNEAYYRAWLARMLRLGGWEVAERAITHVAQESVAAWRQAAREVVLVGILRRRQRELHWQWIQRHRIYYLPLRRNHPRQFAVRSVAFYLPRGISRVEPGVTYMAEVEGIDVMPRSAVPTPWEPTPSADRPVVVYRLGPLRPLDRPIGHPRHWTVRTPLWTSRLALERARVLEELFLETEPEWRLYENLRAAGLPVRVRAGRMRSVGTGRAWFQVGEWRIQYRGAAGFLITSRRATFYRARPLEVLHLLLEGGFRYSEG